jgi:hypothetical protein
MACSMTSTPQYYKDPSTLITDHKSPITQTQPSSSCSWPPPRTTYALLPCSSIVVAFPFLACLCAMPMEGLISFVEFFYGNQLMEVYSLVKRPFCMEGSPKHASSTTLRLGLKLSSPPRCTASPNYTASDDSPMFLEYTPASPKYTSMSRYCRAG